MTLFNHCLTFAFVRAVLEAGRDGVALCTGTHDEIIVDMLSFRPRRQDVSHGRRPARPVGEWTERVIALLRDVK
jgi:hypothetical protein